MAAQNPTHRSSVERALRLLEAVDRRGFGASADELAEEVQLSVEHARRLLRSLVREGYLERLDDGAYVLGGALAMLGQGNREQLVQSRLVAKLASLRDELGAAVYFSRYTDGEVAVQAVVDGPMTPSVHEWVDFRATGHASAIGKCLLAQLDHDGRRDHLSRHPAARFTSRTSIDTGMLLQRLDRHPTTVPMLDLQEYAIGTVCAAVPVTAGSAVGCLALSLPVEEAYRLKDAAETLAAKAAPVLLALTV
ncbi:DNA-binding IclR family transcriptional regulator [Streptacidiphilus sp. MAP12-20]|uniref:IclR family transcriptional regulator n=1 Tax=Streptacidiphilus sp. MAP12-20 TaxID=3156299 RepID=UPI0035114818